MPNTLKINPITDLLSISTPSISKSLLKFSLSKLPLCNLKLKKFVSLTEVNDTMIRCKKSLLYSLFGFFFILIKILYYINQVKFHVYI